MLQCHSSNNHNLCTKISCHGQLFISYNGISVVFPSLLLELPNVPLSHQLNFNPKYFSFPVCVSMCHILIIYVDSL